MEDGGERRSPVHLLSSIFSPILPRSFSGRRAGGGAGEVFEEVGVGFVGALDVVDGDGGGAGGGDGEGHGHAVVVVGVDAGGFEAVGGGDGQVVAVEVDVGAGLGEFGPEGGDAVSFLDAEGVEAAEGGGTGGEAGDDGEGLGHVGHVGHVDVFEAVERVGAGDGDEVLAEDEVGAHLVEGVGEGDVALEG